MKNSAMAMVWGKQGVNIPLISKAWQSNSHMHIRTSPKHKLMNASNYFHESLKFKFGEKLLNPKIMLIYSIQGCGSCLPPIFRLIPTKKCLQHLCFHGGWGVFVERKRRNELCLVWRKDKVNSAWFYRWTRFFVN